jgi:hypothetical protein
MCARRYLRCADVEASVILVHHRAFVRYILGIYLTGKEYTGDFV